VEDFTDAFSPHPQGLTIRFDVVPGSSVVEVPSGFNRWRKSLEAKLTEEPYKGKANRQLIGELARIFGIPKKDVEVLSGHKSSRKVLLIIGLDIDRAASCLRWPDTSEHKCRTIEIASGPKGPTI
jgi:uncharacterized protein (TIGR00251 family)